jgi:uncharacterized membrane protein (UPF0136 family)
MTIAATAIHTAIAEVIDGTIGTTRTVAASAVEPGHMPWVGQVLSKPRFEVTLDSMGRHESTPCSAISTYRIDKLQVTVFLHHKLSARHDVSKRDAAKAEALSLADTITQALGYPNNLSYTSASTSTGIISGMLLGLDRDVVDEQWEGTDRGLTTAIVGTALIKVSQP